MGRRSDCISVCCDLLLIHERIARTGSTAHASVYVVIICIDDKDMETVDQSPCQKEKTLTNQGLQGFLVLAEWTGLEPATPGVTGRYSNQLNYHSW